MIGIKGVQFPKKCDDCPFFDDNHDYPTCIANGKSEGYRSWHKIAETRMDFCPLVEMDEVEE